MARRLGRSAALALCPRAGAHRADQGPRHTPGRDVADRVAVWRDVAKTISFRELVDIAKMRWRIERDYQDLKQEIGLGHYEGRGWRGFHHHGTLCIAAYGFLISERETIPPSGPRSAGMFAKPAISGGYRPRGAAAPAPTARPQLNRDRPLRNGGRDRADAAALPMLRPQISTKHATKFMTQ